MYKRTTISHYQALRAAFNCLPSILFTKYITKEPTSLRPQKMLSITKLAITLASVLGLGFCAPFNSTNRALEKRDGGAGEATYYYQEGAAGSCGYYNSDDAYIGALSTYWMDNNWGWDYCNAPIAVTATSGPAAGTTINILVQDTCESCDEYHIGMYIHTVPDNA